MEIFNVSGSVDLDLDKVYKQIEALDKKLDELSNSTETTTTNTNTFGNTMSKVGGKMQNVGKDLTAKATLPILGLGYAFTNVSGNAQEAQGKFTATFKDMADSSNEFVKKFSEDFDKYDEDIRNMMSTTMAAGKNYGLSAERAAELSEQMQYLTVDIGAYNDMADTDVHQRLIGALRGEGEAAEALQLSINQTTLADYARRQGITKSLDKLTEAEKMELRYGLIVEQSADMQGYATKEAGSFARSKDKLRTSVMELSEAFGTKLLPILQPVIDGVTKFINWLSELDPKMQIVILAIGGLIAIAGPLLFTMGMIATGLGAISTLGAPVLLTIAGITLAILALIAIGYLLIANWQEVKQWCFDVWNGIKGKFEEFDNWLTGIFTTDWSASFGVFGDILNGFFSVCSNIWNNIKNIFSNIINFVKNVFTGNWKGAWQNIVNIFDAIVSNVANIFKIPINAVIALMNGVIGAMNKMKIKTPDWLPGDLGGKEFGINIPKFNYLYTGAVFDGPTLLGGNNVVGDAYKGQGGQREFVTPDNLLRKTIREEVIGAISAIRIDLDGREVGRGIAPYQDEFDDFNLRYV